MDTFLNTRTLVPKTNLVLDSHLVAACFHTEVVVYNFTHVNITVTHRNGLAYELIPTMSTHVEHRNSVVIRHVLTTTRNVINNMASKLNAPSQLLSHAQRYLMETPNFRGQPGPYAPCKASYEHIVQWDKLQSGDDFYIPDSDLCLTIKNIQNAGYHPYSLGAPTQQSTIPDGLIRIKVIDNTETRGRVFMPYHGYVYALDVKRDETLASGVYVDHLIKVFDKDGNSLQSNTYLTLEQAEGGKENFSIYHTKPAAYAALKMKQHDDLLIQQLKNESELAKAKADLAKAESANKEIELKLRLLEKEREELLRKEIIKSKIESRSAFRKELLEVMKLAAPGIALVQLIIKLRSGS